jgi:hypothetical protein
MAAGVPVLAVVPMPGSSWWGTGSCARTWNSGPLFSASRSCCSTRRPAVEELGSRGRDVAVAHSHGYLVDRMEAMYRSLARQAVPSG